MLNNIDNQQEFNVRNATVEPSDIEMTAYLRSKLIAVATEARHVYDRQIDI